MATNLVSQEVKYAVVSTSCYAFYPFSIGKEKNSQRSTEREEKEQDPKTREEEERESNQNKEGQIDVQQGCNDLLRDTSILQMSLQQYTVCIGTQRLKLLMVKLLASLHTGFLQPEVKGNLLTGFQTAPPTNPRALLY